MVAIEKSKNNIQVISLENLLERTPEKDRKEMRKLFGSFDRTKLENSYDLLRNLETNVVNYFKKLAKPEPSFKFQGQYVGFDSPDLIPKLKPTIQYVSQEYLNHLAGVNYLTGQVLGAFDPLSNAIYILNTLTGVDHDKTLHHEKEHWKDPNASESEVRRRTAMAGYL